MEDTVCGNKVTATPPAWEKWHAHAHHRKGAERGPRPLGQAQDFHAWPWQLSGATPSSSWDKYTRLWVRGHYPTGRLSLDPRSILKWILLWEQSGRLGRGSAAPWGNQIPPQPWRISCWGKKLLCKMLCRWSLGQTSSSQLFDNSSADLSKRASPLFGLCFFLPPTSWFWRGLPETG